MDEVAELVAGECPHCCAEVPYEDWLAIEGEEGVMGCPTCNKVTLVDTVFPPITALAQQGVANSQRSAA